MRVPLLLIGASLVLINSVYAQNTSDNQLTKIMDRLSVAEKESAKQSRLNNMGWFYINVYGGGSYQFFPEDAQSKYQALGEFYDIFQPVNHMSVYYEVKFGVRPFEYLSFALSYWGGSGKNSELIYQTDNGAQYKNGQSQMSFSGVDFYTTAHIPLANQRHELQLSAGPAIIFSSFDPELKVTGSFSQDLKKTHKTNIRPFVAVEYQYMLGESFTIGTKLQYIFGVGEDVYAPYYGGNYVPSILSFSVSLGYQFF